jgi:hypothetical protein
MNRGNYYALIIDMVKRRFAHNHIRKPKTHRQYVGVKFVSLEDVAQAHQQFRQKNQTLSQETITWRARKPFVDVVIATETTDHLTHVKWYFIMAAKKLTARSMVCIHGAHRQKRNGPSKRPCFQLTFVALSCSGNVSRTAAIFSIHNWREGVSTCLCNT